MTGCIDACLDAFTRDFNPNRVSWYATMLQQLDPSVGEVAARSAKYLGLLAATSKAGVKLGQEGAARLLDADLLAAPAPFLAASAPALLFPQKSIAAAQLKLIGRLAGHPRMLARQQLSQPRRHSAMTGRTFRRQRSR